MVNVIIHNVVNWNDHNRAAHVNKNGGCGDTIYHDYTPDHALVYSDNHLVDGSRKHINYGHGGTMIKSTVSITSKDPYMYVTPWIMLPECLRVLYLDGALIRVTLSVHRLIFHVDAQSKFETPLLSFCKVFPDKISMIYHHLFLIHKATWHIIHIFDFGCILMVMMVLCYQKN